MENRKRVGLVHLQFLRDVLTAHLDFAFVLAGLCKIVARLHAYPRVRGAAERLRKPDRHFGANAGLTVNDLCEGLPGDAENLRACRHGQAQRLQTGALGRDA
jgi:hypothetical protein